MCFISLGTLAVKIFLRSIRLFCSVSIIERFSTIGKNSKKRKKNHFFGQKTLKRGFFGVVFNNFQPFILNLLTSFKQVMNKISTKNLEVINSFG